MKKKERLKKAIDYLRGEGVIRWDKDVASKMGADPANLSSALKGNETYLTERFLHRFNEAFDNIFDIDWLISGNGAMFNVNAKVNNIPTSQTETRPRLPWKAMSSGGLRAYYAGEFRKECEERPIFDGFPQYQFSITVDTGDMSPYLNVGDLVACREISIDHIIWGGVYLIDTDGGAMIRRVYEVSNNKNKVKLVADNEKYPEFSLDKKNVNDIYKIVGSVRIGI